MKLTDTVARGTLTSLTDHVTLPMAGYQGAACYLSGTYSANVDFWVSVDDGATGATTGLQLSAGQTTDWLPIDNLNRLYRICDNAGDDLTYLALS